VIQVREPLPFVLKIMRGIVCGSTTRPIRLSTDDSVVAATLAAVSFVVIVAVIVVNISG
jgi:hypothetical protein